MWNRLPTGKARVENTVLEDVPVHCLVVRDEFDAGLLGRSFDQLVDPSAVERNLGIAVLGCGFETVLVVESTKSAFAR